MTKQGYEPEWNKKPTLETRSMKRNTRKRKKLPSMMVKPFHSSLTARMSHVLYCIVVHLISFFFRSLHSAKHTRPRPIFSITELERVVRSARPALDHSAVLQLLRIHRRGLTDDASPVMVLEVLHAVP